MYDDVLLATDGNPPAAAATERAVDLAARYDATLHAVFVVETAIFSRVDVEFDAVVESFENQGRRVLADVERAAREAGVPVETAVLRGPPARTVVEAADERGADLIVVGTHGRRGVDRILLGSVAERVLRLATVPVLIVHGDEDEE